MSKIMKIFIFAALMTSFFRLSGAEKEFRLGVYIYDYMFNRIAQKDGVPLNEFVNKHFKILKDNGVNAIHLAVTDSTGLKLEEIWLPALKKNNIKAYLQLDFAYFVPGKHWTESYEAKQAEKAGKFIGKYKNNPEILGFSIREEVAHKDVNAMARYYQKIMEHAQDFSIFTLHNNLGAAKDQPVPDPVFYGTDRYGFWWEFSAGGYLASPDFALNWIRNEAAKYYPEAAKRGADFVFVATANRYMTASKDIEKSWGKRNFFKRVEKYIQTNNFGWTKSTVDNKDIYWTWKYYSLPENCLRAQIWTGILEGAKTVLFWSYTPVAQAEMKLTPAELLIKKIGKNKSLTGNATWTTLAGRDGVENFELKEFAATAQEIAPYKKLIPEMRKLEKSVVRTDKKRKFFNRSFSFNGMSGKAIVIHNANVGKWGANSRYFFNENDDIKIDGHGRMTGYKPFTEPAEVEFTPENPADKIFDFKTGKEIPVVNGKGKVSVIPGGGVIIFVGTEKEFNKIYSSVK